MTLFRLFSKTKRIPTAVAEAVASLSHQIHAARKFFPTEHSLEETLKSSNVLLFVHGFISYYAIKHGLNSSTHVWTVTIKTMEDTFSSGLGNTMILALQGALHHPEYNPTWFDEGVGAANYADTKGMTLLASFLQGARS